MATVSDSVKREASYKAGDLQKAAESIQSRLGGFRNILAEASAHRNSLRLEQRPPQRRIAEAELALAQAKAASAQETLAVAIENFSAMWQELRAELDMAHVLAVTPE
jgi:predicted peptidase